MPTFLHAAQVAKPTTHQIDGISLLSVLKRAQPLPVTYTTSSMTDPILVQQLIHSKKHIPGEKEIIQRYFPQYLDHQQGKKNGKEQSRRRRHRKQRRQLNHQDELGKDPTTTTSSHHGFAHPDASITTAMNRVFLWHKDTDPFSRDERIQSAGYYDDFKILSSTNGGCIDRMFDLKYDPLEKMNLLANGYAVDRPRGGNLCRLNFENANPDTIANILPKDNIGVTKHCLHYTNSPTPVHRALNLLFGKTGGGGGGGGGHGETAAGMSKEECMKQYHALQVTKVWIILQKLIPFVRYGNHGHNLYMRDHGHWGLCAVPNFRDVRAMNYTLESDCTKFKYGCTYPEH